MNPLPIEQALPALRAALAAHPAAVLEAPPGAGKTTRVPLALLGEPWLAGRAIVMLEPRRLATHAAARYMARTLGQQLGGTVGYRVRGESRVTRATRVEVVTEGILTRRLQHDPALDGVGLVIFDEFHERSVHADLGLALTLQSQSILRDDLRILVMSATLDVDPVAALLGGAPIVRSEGRAYHVETRYLPRRPDARLEADVVSAVSRAVAEEPGDVLVFLPGAAEIRRVAEQLPHRFTDSPPHRLTVSPPHVYPLFGDLPAADQDAAIAPSPLGERKVVLATNIAQTSLTIDGVRVVVDTGLARAPVFSPRTGMTRLETVRVSRASADQRRGRAGRTAPGVCYRLWDEHENHHLLPHDQPEILAADLAPLALELAVSGIDDPAELKWLDLPPAPAYRQARELLVELGALDANGRVTAHGRRMAELGTHPRLAHLLLRGAETGATELAAVVAALLDERDVLRGEGAPPPADFTLRVDAVLGKPGSIALAGARVDSGAVRRVRELAARWRDALTREASNANRASPDTAPSIGALLALAYPDRVAQRRPGQRTRYLLRNGQGAVLGDAAAFADAEYLVIAETDGRQPESRIYSAAPIDRVELDALLSDQYATDDEYRWDPERASVVAQRITRLGAIPLSTVRISAPDTTRVAEVLARELLRRGVDALPWSDDARSLRQRVAFLRTLDAAWPDLGDDALAASADSWLAPLLLGARTLDDVRRLDLSGALRGMLNWEQRAALDTLAPTHLAVPTGSRIAIDYSAPEAPVLAVRLQEMFGLAETPRVGGGRVPLTLHLLSPARRPVQVTRDLAGFWRDSYFDVRKDLRGRYPKHYWPDDPLQAEPTRHTRRPPERR
ncbi:MAG: ATP-dependent helicase HrpB [Gemmatimonadota bacterium]|nr:ATP-dependent helicase HrpB [Gemmatimonadota bacterium]